MAMRKKPAKVHRLTAHTAQGPPRRRFLERRGDRCDGRGDVAAIGRGFRASRAPRAAARS